MTSTKPRRWALALAALAIVTLTTWAVRAHTIGISTGEYTASNASLRAKLVFARADVLALVPVLDANGDGHVSAQEVTGARSVLHSKILERIEVVRGDKACTSILLDAALTEQDGFLLDGRFDCEGEGGSVQVRVALLDDLPERHRHIARIVGSTTHDQVVDRSNAKFEVTLLVTPSGPSVEPPKPTRSSTTGFGLLRLGIEHILTGYDHLAFLLGLVIVRARVRQLVGMVTAFTVAHSVTLALASLGVLAPGPRLVEPLIALSIAYVGIENFFLKDARKRWRIAFVFGLVHGFGFAGALREISIPRADIPLSLLSFNVGVEIGQVAALAVALPILHWVRQRHAEFEERGTRAVSGGVLLAGLGLFLARLVG